MTGKGKWNPVSYRSKSRVAPARRAARPIPIGKIVSGGQTGVDRAALDVARELSLACGGWCPRGRRAEDGAIPARYPLVETPRAAYPQRTEWNVRDSDATLVLASDVSGARIDIAAGVPGHAPTARCRRSSWSCG